MQNIFIAIAAVVVIGGGVWYATSQSGNTPAATNNAETETVATEQATSKTVAETKNSGFGSLSSLFGLGDSLHCEFSYTDQEGSGSGVLYTDGQRFRMESEQNSPEGRMTSNLVNDGAFTYVWGQAPQGEMALKMPNPEEDVGDPFAELREGPESREYVNVDEEVSYDCNNWRVDTSKFVPPSNVEFVDMASMMQEMLGNMPEGIQLPEGIELPEGVELPAGMQLP